MSYVMVVDDDPGILQLIRTGLRKAGYEVGYAETAEEALTKIAKRKPDILITDAMMPGKDGYALARELRNMAETSALPIIMLTALQQEQDALKAFREGVDDFISKPFSMPVLRARINALLVRVQALKNAFLPVIPELPVKETALPQRISSDFPALDQALEGGIPLGSNVLVIGETGAGKSTLARRFITAGLQNRERCMLITLDDDPAMIRSILDGLLVKENLHQYEQDNFFRLVDCYSWNRGMAKTEEKFAISGMMELNQLASIVSDAGAELGQTITEKLGGRRVVDSVSSLFVNFELLQVQRFLAQLARTASAYGGVATIFILEAGAISERELNNVKYLMDVVLELKLEDLHLARVLNMKWSKFFREWVSIEG
jgi:CheY-like chemotaxis protein/KaiC/GvpD/RAD55 family RecA-like ATPase